MNDIITPSGLDLTKNLHGHVRVETRSRWTGKVIDSQEKDNLVTNALQKILDGVAWQYTGSDSSATGVRGLLCPIHSKGLGSVILFDSTLTESVDNIWLPSNAKIVAIAGQESDTANADRGSLNAPESVVMSNGFTTVWDFATSQANGTIASLARSSRYFTHWPAFYYTSSSTWTWSINYGVNGGLSPECYYLGYDGANEYLYIAGNGGSLNGVSYPSSNIYRVKFSFDKVSLYGQIPPASHWTLIKTLTSSDGNTTAYYWTYDKYANNFVYLNSNTLHILALDGTHTTKTLGGSGTNFAVTENYYWRSTSSNIYRIAKSNVSDMATIQTSSNYIVPCEHDILAAISANTAKLVYPDDTISLFTGSQAPNYNLRDVGNFVVYFAGTSLYPRINYLGTIANLDSPVTKTSSQTMKITYTLTES